MADDNHRQNQRSRRRIKQEAEPEPAQEPTAEQTRFNRLVIPVLLFALALTLRLIGLRWGLPSAEHYYSYHPDERQIAVAVANLDFFSGDFNPHFFNYPSLYIYLVYIAHFFGSGLGVFPTMPTENVVWPFLHNVMLTGRFITAILGAATVPLVYFMARQIGGPPFIDSTRIGVLAALLLAFLPGHVQHSHFATVDVPATFFVTLSLFFAMRALQPERETPWRNRQLLWAAFVAGLAAATKYNAGLVIVSVLAAWWILPRDEEKRKWRFLATIPALGVLGFLLGCPFSVLDFPTFWGDCQNQGVCYELLVHPGQGHGLAFVQVGNGWWYHLTYNLPFAMTWPILAMVLVGMVVYFCGSIVLRRFTNTEEFKKRCPNFKSTSTDQPLLIWLVVYFFASGLSQVLFMRYMLPIMPALSVFATLIIFALSGILAAGIVFRSRRKGQIPPTSDNHMDDLHNQGQHTSAIISGLFLIFVLVGTFNVLYPFITPDPRDQAALWLRQNASTPTTVGLLNKPWFWTPPLSPQDAAPGSGMEVTQSPDGLFQLAVTGFDGAQLEAQKPQWFVMNEFEFRDEARLNNAGYQAFMQQLNSEYSLRARFKNQPPFEWPGRIFVPHDWLYTNPEIRIYERNP